MGIYRTCGLPTLGRDLHTSIPVIQWVPTIYLLAFASVIPLTGWTAGRFGARRVWLASLGLFMAGSLLAGLSPSIGALIGSRVVQGIGGGMIMPLGQSILAQAAGPKRMGRVMSIAGVPMLLAPIFSIGCDGRPAPFLRDDVGERLGECPLVTRRILDVVLALAVLEVGRLHEDAR